MWAKWKDLYKTTEASKRVRMQATDGKDQFGAAHHYGNGNLVPLAYVPTAPTAAAATVPPSLPPSGKTQGEALEEYFDALAAAASTDQNVLSELTASVSKLTKANNDLVQAVSKLTKANKVISAQVGKAGRGSSERRTVRPKKYCPNCNTS